MAEVKGFYDHYWTKGFSPTGQTVDPAIGRLLDRYAGQTMIDVGCGDAVHGGGWAKANGRDYTGFDVSSEAVALSQQHGFQAEVIEDATRLPLEDATVDTVLCTEVLEHLFSPLDAVREMRRVLKPGGTLIVSVPNIAYWRTRFDLAVMGRWQPAGDHLSVSEPWRDPHLRFFTPRTLAAMLAEAGAPVTEFAAVPYNVLSGVPGVRRLARNTGPISTFLCDKHPALFASHICAACQ